MLALSPMTAHSQSWWSRPAGARDVLQVALPLVVSTSSWTLMQFIDRVFLIHYSPDTMAAALPATMLVFNLICFFLGVASYANTFVGQYHGAGHPERIGLAVWQAIFIGLAVTPLVMLTIPLAPTIFASVGHSSEVTRLETICYQINCCGAGPIVICSAISAFYTGRGHTRVVMLVDIFGAIVNIALDWLLIFGNAGFPEMGIAGASWATVIAMWVKTGIYFFLLLRPANRAMYNTLVGCRFDADLMRRLFRFGSASGGQFLIDVSAFTAFLFLVGRIGSKELTASNLAFNVNNIAFMPVLGFGIATATLVAQKLGENNPELAARATWSSFWLSSIYTIAIAVAYVAAPGVFLVSYGLMAEAEDIGSLRELTTVLLRFVGAYCFLDSVNMIFSSALKGAGDTRFVLLSTCVLSGLTVLLIWIGVVYMGQGLLYAWTILTLWICVLGAVYMARFIHGRWRSMRVIEREYLTELAPESA